MSTTYSNSITLGNILTIGAMVVTMTLAYGRLTAADEALATRATAIELVAAKETADYRAVSAATEGRLRALEIVQTRVDAQFGAMRDSLAEIKDQNRSIEALVRQLASGPTRAP